MNKKYLVFVFVVLVGTAVILTPGIFYLIITFSDDKPNYIPDDIPDEIIDDDSNNLEWIWFAGGKTPYIYSVYGTKGVPNESNYPGCRSSSITWVDSDDNVWLFGGHGYAESGSDRELNDLWKFDGFNWTWISGNKTIYVSGVYGTKGIPDENNCPGCRTGSISWIDSDNNLWLFGGNGWADTGDYGSLNDLWRFDGTNWTWISGNKTTDVFGVYGTKGIPDKLKYPGSRHNAISWIDSNDNLWLFGGSGYAESGEGYLNDLWRFDGANWTWISGNKTLNIHGIYGSKNISNKLSFPGSRHSSISWIDSNDNLWLFGGRGYAVLGVDGRLNDLWRFDGVNWTWISGNETGMIYCSYGIKGVPDQNNYPGSRDGSISWIDSKDNFWLFGGIGFTTSGPDGMINDLWRFDGVNWTWMSGNKTIEVKSIYGTKGIPSEKNHPGSRTNAISWMDAEDNIWLFGGFGYGEFQSGRLNDLWKLKLPL